MFEVRAPCAGKSMALIAIVELDDTTISRYENVRPWLVKLKFVGACTRSDYSGYPVAVAVFAITVLGIDAFLASIFLPNLHSESVSSWCPRLSCSHGLFKGDFTILR